MVTTLPFAKQFESANSYGALDWPWGTTPQQAHSGTHALIDSPGTLYSNNTDRSSTLRVDLRLANRPVLAFWQMYDLELNRDCGFVEEGRPPCQRWPAPPCSRTPQRPIA